MVSVFETIIGHIGDQNVHFVFPSETAALVWARKICLHGSVRSIAQDRFLAWDRFKETAVRAGERDRRPASSLIRRLFALDLARKNAAAPFLSSIIPGEFAGDGEVFAPFIARTLSSLAYWEERRDKAGGPGGDDEEDRDLRIIKSRYGAFLESRGLFEPSWEKPAFQETGRRYIIFFPGVLDDFAEYQEPLSAGGIELYPVEAAASPAAESAPPRFFESARTEIRSAAEELRRLHGEEGIPYEDMALSLPDFDSLEPYVTRELTLRDIPFTRRAGKSLGDYPAGRLFSLIAECASSQFSFDSLKPLLLNAAIPWKDPAMNRALIRFGVENHCVAPFSDRGRTVDPWEEGFKRRGGGSPPALAAYYRELKRGLSGFASGKTFKEIRERYFAFRSLLAMEEQGPEGDAVLARCVEELSALMGAEEEFPDLFERGPRPFAFFVSHLREKTYVYPQEGGVNIYDYPVAAGAPFACQMVLNASQAAASARRGPLPFLRQDKRARLGLEDRDVSAPVLALYRAALLKDRPCRAWISASEKTFTGWAIPHSAFALTMERRDAAAPADPFGGERRWWAALTDAGGAGEGRAGLPPLFSVQRRGFAAWSGVLLARGGAGGGAASAAEAPLRERIARKNRGGEGEPPGRPGEPPPLSVSATDLNEFFTCPVLWLYRRIFRLEPRREDAALLDDESRGLIYHEILRRLFGRIKERDGAFRAENLAEYSGWVEEITAGALKSDDTLRGPLVYPLLEPLAASMARRLRGLLQTEAAYFSGYQVGALEETREVARGGVRLRGRIDRVSLGAGGAMIIDYKTNAAPSRTRSRADPAAGPAGEPGLGDFQIPMYIKLYEETEGQRVNQAFFVSVNKNEIVPVVGDLEGKRDLCSREAYEPSMEALERGIARFARAVAGLDFTPPAASRDTCAPCEYRTICRSCYSLNKKTANSPPRRETAFPEAPPRGTGPSSPDF
ncbi:MAG: PD-(D/E)XK nuclease family protein [Treponema sp.]|jgi:CRISPR/Cas system-associated exonuclease Cas4 (RecB family)|nr:PD-(D/E)XK nuclease family protein [Treponema sp.]